MKLVLLPLLIFLSTGLSAQSFRLEGNVSARELGAEIGQITVFSLPDSSLIKGSYLDTNDFSFHVPKNGGDNFYAKIKLRGYVDTLINFTVMDTVVNIGLINMQRDLNLATVEIVYREPLYERTMDGIKVNVDGTTLETMDNLFEVLKSSPKLMSPDDEAIEIIGKGAPLILIDRQPILTNDELKAIPANMIERIEIITNPSAKYRAQGRSNGVIEVYTKDFRLQGYNMNISLSGGLNTQLKPTSRLGIGLSVKKNKLSFNTYISGNYRSQNSYGTSEQMTTDGSNRDTYSSFENDGWNLWQHLSLKSAYQINDNQKITAGLRGGGSVRQGDGRSNTTYYENEELSTEKNMTTESDNTWMNNSAFLNYFWETDTNKSSLEVNLNYRLKINEGATTYHSEFEDVINTALSNFDLMNDSRNRPNIGEIKATYEHVFDTSGWKWSGGGSFSMIFNGMKFDQLNLIGNDWQSDPLFSNSYDYVEQIGSFFTEVTKNWGKLGVRAGVTAEYTDLNGYSNSLSQQFIDSTYLLPFPSVSVMYNPSLKVAMTWRYSSGIDRPQFSNYDPFVRVQDSLSIQYGNPFLRPSVKHNFGFDLDLFYMYGFSVDYSYTDRPNSTLMFIDDSTFLLNSTPWNAARTQNLSVSFNIPLKTKWMNSWNSFSVGYNKYEFTSIFERPDLFNLTYSFWSYMNFMLKGNITITNHLSIYKWGNSVYLTDLQANWGVKITKKMFNNKLSVFLDVSDIVPPKNVSSGFAGNFESTSISQYQFTSFKIGLRYKFGRLKNEAQIKESSSGQGSRI